MNKLDVKYLMLLGGVITATPFVWNAASEETIMFKVGILGLSITIVLAIAYHYWLTVLKWRFRK